MNFFEALLFSFLVLLQSTCLAAASVNEAERINAQKSGGGFLRGKQSPPRSEGSKRRLLNVFSMNKSMKNNNLKSQRWHKSSKSMKSSYSNAYPSKEKGHYYNRKGYGYKGKGASKRKSSLPDSNFSAPKNKGLWRRPLGPVSSMLPELALSRSWT